MKQTSLFFYYAVKLYYERIWEVKKGRYEGRYEGIVFILMKL